MKVKKSTQETKKTKKPEAVKPKWFPYPATGWPGWN